MLRLACIAFLIVWALPQTSLHAATIKVTGDNPQQTITVAIENARVGVVLQYLRRSYGFEVAGLQKANQGESLTVTMSGSLQSILERLLRNWNHMIVRSGDNKSGIAKVMILNSVYGSAPSQLKRKNATRDRYKKKISKKLEQADKLHKKKISKKLEQADKLRQSYPDYSGEF